MKAEIKEKLEEVVVLINKLMVDPDIDIEYHIPGIAETPGSSNLADEDPFILVKYVISQYTVPTRKIRLGRTYLLNSPQKIADLVTFSIEAFKTEIDSVEMG